MVFILFGCFRMIIYLYLVAIEHRHPGFARRDGYANENARVAVGFLHAVNNAYGAIAELFLAPIQQAHTAVTTCNTVFDIAAAGAHHLPAIQIFAVKQLPPTRFVQFGRFGDSILCEGCGADGK